MDKLAKSMQKYDEDYGQADMDDYDTDGEDVCNPDEFRLDVPNPNTVSRVRFEMVEDRYKKTLKKYNRTMDKLNEAEDAATNKRKHSTDSSFDGEDR